MTYLHTVLTDGRPHILETLPAWRSILPSGTKLLIVDDSGDEERRSWITDHADMAVFPASERAGYSKAMQVLMKAASATDADYIFFTEDDFVPIAPPSLDELRTILEQRPHLSQVVLPRPPWFPKEKKAGNSMRMMTNPRRHPAHSNGDSIWIEHDRFWSCNPSLFPKWVSERPWPSGSDSERRFGKELVRDKYRFAMYGMWDGAPVVDHIGANRAGWGY